MPSPSIGIVDLGDRLVGADLDARPGLEQLGLRAPARCSSSIAAWTCGRRHVVGLDHDSAGMFSPGERRLDPVVGLHHREVARERVDARQRRCSAERRHRQRDQQRRPTTTATASGRLSTRSRIARPDARLAARAAAAGRGTGSGPCRRGRRASASTAGSTVSEPSIATATTRIVPVANEANVASPAKYMPAIATITVRPEMSTARPDVAAAASSAASLAAPGRALLTLTAQVEQRVVDAHRQADQQDHRADRLVHRRGSG